MGRLLRPKHYCMIKLRKLTVIQKGRRLNLPTYIMLKLLDSLVCPNTRIINKNKTENGSLLDENIKRYKFNKVIFVI